MNPEIPRNPEHEKRRQELKNLCKALGTTLDKTLSFIDLDDDTMDKLITELRVEESKLPFHLRALNQREGLTPPEEEK